MVVFDELTVCEDPVSKSEEEERSFVESSEDRIAEFVIIVWRLLIDVVDHELLQEVNHHERSRGNREENGHSNTESHSNEYNVKDAGVLPMDHPLRTCKYVDILLDGHTLGVISSDAILESHCRAEEGPENFHNDWEVKIEHHRPNNNVSS
jgi:hypothetical protein